MTENEYTRRLEEMERRLRMVERELNLIGSDLSRLSRTIRGTASEVARSE